MSSTGNAIAICGHIGSGKSTIVAALRSTFGWEVVSFGRYVKAIALDRGLEPNRKTLQDLGQTLIDEGGVDRFLLDVVDFCHPSSQVHLFDGVRHVAMIDAIRRQHEATYVLFMDVIDSVRYQRYVSRTVAAPISYQEFLSWKDHPVEREIDQIRQVADLCVDAAMPVIDLCEVITVALHALHLL